MGFRVRVSGWRRRLAYAYLAVLAAVVVYGVYNYVAVARECWGEWFSGIGIGPLDDRLFNPVVVMEVEVGGGYLNLTFLRTHVKPYIKDLEIIAELHTVKGRVYRLREQRRVASGQVFRKSYYIERMREVYGRISEVRIVVEIEGEVVLEETIQLEKR